MIDCTLLRQDGRYLYRGQYLTYQYQIPGAKPRYVFQTARGTERILSQQAVRKEVWEEINTSKLEALNEE